MSFISFICPFLYAMILGSAWSIWFRKPFYSSLAPAFFLHILAVMISGMLFKRLSVGIFGAIVLAIVILVCCMVRKNKSLSPVDLKAYGKEIWDNGGAVFAIFYVLCFILNANKSFIHWDEFSHWGPFLKESLRLDQLYCMSPMDFAHKDYVPAVTIFEAIWCRLGFRYTEPDAYRAIQVLMFSMFMPVFEKFHSYAYEQSGGNRSGNNGSMKKIIKYRLLQVGAVLLVLMYLRIDRCKSRALGERIFRLPKIDDRRICGFSVRMDVSEIVEKTRDISMYIEEKTDHHTAVITCLALEEMLTGIAMANNNRENVIDVMLREKGKDIEISIRDMGVGFNPLVRDEALAYDFDNAMVLQSIASDIQYDLSLGMNDTTIRLAGNSERQCHA